MAVAIWNFPHRNCIKNFFYTLRIVYHNKARVQFVLAQTISTTLEQLIIKRIDLTSPTIPRHAGLKLLVLLHILSFEVYCKWWPGPKYKVASLHTKLHSYKLDTMQIKFCTSESFHYVHQGSEVVATPSCHWVSNWPSACRRPSQLTLITYSIHVFLFLFFLSFVSVFYSHLHSVL